MKSLSQSTQTLYKSKLGKLARLGVTDLSNTSQVIQSVNSISTNLNTQKTYLQAVFHENPDPAYKSQLELLYKQLREQEYKDGTKQLTTKQVISFISWDQLVAIRNNFSEQLNATEQLRLLSKVKYQKKLPYKQLVLLSLYTLLPPRRIADYLHMYCYINRPENLDTTINYYIQSERKFIFNIYKTSPVYGTQEVDIPVELHQVIENYIIVYKIAERDSLLGYSSEENLSDAIGTLYQELTEKRVTVDIIRHSWSIHRDRQGRTADQIKADAVLMAHSFEQEVRYVKDTPTE